MTPYGTPVWADELLSQVVGQLLKGTGFPADCVFDSLASDDAHLRFPAADRFVTVRPDRFPTAPGFTGGGRALTGFDGSVRVALYYRYAADQELRSTRLLRDRTKGVLGEWLKVLDALQGFAPADAAGNALVKEPMRIDAGGFRVLPKSVSNQQWCVVESTWEMKFIAPLS